MNAEISMHDTVALLEDLPAKHFLTGQPLLLRRGQVGTVVMTYDGRACEVEFSGRDPPRGWPATPGRVPPIEWLRDGRGEDHQGLQSSRALGHSHCWPGLARWPAWRG